MKKSYLLSTIAALTLVLAAGGGCKKKEEAKKPAGATEVQKPQEVKKSDPAQDKALIDATKAGNVAAVEAAFKNGASPNAKDEKGNVALYHVLTMAHAPQTIVALLKAYLAAKVDANAVHGPESKTISIVQACHMHNVAPELIKLLVDAGVNINAKAPDGQTALHVAAAGSGEEALVKFILTLKPDVNAAMEDGWTAVMKAAYFRNIESLKALIAAKADVNLKSTGGRSALEIAKADTADDAKEVVKLLQAAGAK
jgi:ankyrin repeat protein